MKAQRVTFVAVVASMVMACASNAPPSLTPAGVRIWQANEAVVALGTLQHVAIQLNGVQRCEAPPNDAVCAPVLSTQNTGVVVDAVTAALTTVRQVPSGWKPTALAALTQIEARLDAAGKTKLSAYVVAARTVIEALL